MKVLLTGASGFVGSHILDVLRKRNLPAVVLLRPTSSRRFISTHLDKVEIRDGEFRNAASLNGAVTGITHVIHCAGATKSATVQGFFEVNQTGTRKLVDAANRAGTVERFLLVSSLAAAGPGTPENPAEEDAPPEPVTPYGQSKLNSERELIQNFRGAYTIVRPPAVYGPRDDGFLPLFKAVNRGILPWPGARQALSLVYVEDLAESIIQCLLAARAAGRTYFSACSEVTSAREFGRCIEKALGKKTVKLPLPNSLLWAVCMGHDLKSRITGVPHILSRHKYAEIKAPGWVCATSRLGTELGYACTTKLQEGVTKTATWYLKEGWI